MSQPREIGEESTPDHAAATWFARRRGGLRARDEREFAKWLDADPANRAAYAEVAHIWEIAGDVASSTQIARMRSDALMIRRPRENRVGYWRGLAAAMLLTITGAGGWQVFHSPAAPVTSTASAAPLLLQTGIGERSTVTLNDGSVVTLNTNSKLRVAFTPGRRDVVLLAGQALFQVAQNKSRPFVVTAGDRQVVAVGTLFDVRVDPRGVRVALIEGRVKVQRIIQARPAGAHTAAAGWQVAPGPVAILEPGEQLSSPADGTAFVRIADVPDLLSWREGRVRFDSTPLGEAVAEMNRYSRVPIVIADPRVAQIRVSGAFRTGQSRSFVASVTDLFPVHADTTADAIILRKAD